MSIENSKYWSHVTRYFSDSLSASEEQELFNWLELHPDYKKEFEQIQVLWKSAGSRNKTPEFDQKILWNSLQQKIQMSNEEEDKIPHIGLKTNFSWLKYAAILLLVVGIGFLLKTGLDNNIDEGLIAIEESIQNSEAKEPVETKENAETIDTVEEIESIEIKKTVELMASIEVVTAAGEKKSINLPDGSTIELTENSKLNYPKDFGKNQRDVTLTGEARFKVKRDSKRPFTILAKNTKTTVLGTSFSVKAREEDNQVIVEVFTGRVEFSSVDGFNSIILNKEEKGIYENSKITKSSTKEFDIGSEPVKK